MSEVRDIWDQAAHLYDEIYAGNVPYHRSHEVIADLLPKGRAIHVLDLGAGTGLLAARILQRLPESRLTCLDFSANMIEECRRRLAPHGPRADFVCDDIAGWTPTGSYDAVVACNSLVYREIDLGGCYARYASALAAGGLFLNSTVVKQEEVPVMDAILGNLPPPDARPPSPAVLEFARGKGRKIAHFGQDSLAVAHSVEEHLALMRDAGLSAACPWRYLSQAVILGVKTE